MSEKPPAPRTMIRYSRFSATGKPRPHRSEGEDDAVRLPLEEVARTLARQLYQLQALKTDSEKRDRIGRKAKEAEQMAMAERDRRVEAAIIRSKASTAGKSSGRKRRGTGSKREKIIKEAAKLALKKRDPSDYVPRIAEKSDCSERYVRQVLTGEEKNSRR